MYDTHSETVLYRFKTQVMVKYTQHTAVSPWPNMVHLKNTRNYRKKIKWSNRRQETRTIIYSLGTKEISPRFTSCLL